MDTDLAPISSFTNEGLSPRAAGSVATDSPQFLALFGSAPTEELTTITYSSWARPPCANPARVLFLPQGMSPTALYNKPLHTHHLRTSLPGNPIYIRQLLLTRCLEGQRTELIRPNAIKQTPPPTSVLQGEDSLKRPKGWGKGGGKGYLLFLA